MNEFIITFRETLEAALIVGIIYTVISRQGLTKEIKQLWYAVIASIITSVVVGLSLMSIKDSIGNASIEKLVEAVLMYVTAGLLWYVIFWLSKQVSNKEALEGQTSQAIQTSGMALFFLVFFAILREGFETAIFLMGSFSVLGSFSYVGFFLGMFIAVLIGYMVVVQGRKVDLTRFFRITTFLLAVFASGMIAYGTHEAEEFLVKGDHLEWVGLEDKSLEDGTVIKAKDQIARVWNVHKPKPSLAEGESDFFYSYNLHGKDKYSHWLHDKGRVGVFLKGFTGYNSNPNWPEFLLWFISLAFGLRLWRKFYFSK
ncbi:MAG: iron permease FTR1 family protein [Gammaproteobacteria bacterium]|nr:iron permease FTR1 family protein [Gammaproteobacteria bacterium]HJL95679.1 FTR1 family protein [SAR86 cluster bacterium]HJM59679.1 FTR1 family protein [SAR86 cluster bacterium]|tara:strand:+ start:4888 stop:5826 length:939 start_codon:yes stop_codon:yes gene_type:complete